MERASRNSSLVASVRHPRLNPKQICLDLCPEVLGGEFLKKPGVEVARVVNEDVDAAEPLDGCGHGLLRVVRTRHVEFENQQFIRLAERRRHGISIAATG